MQTDTPVTQVKGASGPAHHTVPPGIDRNQPDSSLDLYRLLLGSGDLQSDIREPNRRPSDKVKHRQDAAHAYLKQQLHLASSLDSDLPAAPGHLQTWIEQGVRSVGQQYQAYLLERRHGQRRRYFRSKSHALYFLKGVAPTKLVDGAWLYGLVRHWRDSRFHPLIRTYLEELGEGLATHNHVALYQALLARYGVEDTPFLNDGHYVQGTIQLALAHQADQFLPELIGYNLGYEQLPLHLLITAYELRELGIDPYYFTLHITVDNADTGHAHKALQGLSDTLPRLADEDSFWQRVRQGYDLNLLGESTLSVIGGFDLEQELLKVLQRKSIVGQWLHSDYCQLDGRTVNQWLAEPAAIAEFLRVLERREWIKRHEPPMHSRFWQLIQGERAPMFGVFSPYERQLIHDWIAGDLVTADVQPSAKHSQRVAQFTRPNRQNATTNIVSAQSREYPADPISRFQSAGRDSASDIECDRQLLAQGLAGMGGRAEMLDRLVPFLAPAIHHTPLGLLATRRFSELLG